MKDKKILEKLLNNSETFSLLSSNSNDPEILEKVFEKIEYLFEKTKSDYSNLKILLNNKDYYESLKKGFF